MSLGSWLGKKREDLKGHFIQKAVDGIFARVDAWGAKKWPVGWIRVRRAGTGWKMIGGFVLMYAPEILDHVPMVAYAFGLDDAQAKGVVEVVGRILFLIGAADKYIKFTKPIERRSVEREATSESGEVVAVAPAATAVSAMTRPAVNMLTTEEKVVFDNVFNAEIKKGEFLELASDAAAIAVLKMRATKK
jgi:hypothetical protein